MQLKTSTKISLKFTLFTTIILLTFSIVTFVLFFEIRYTKQKNTLRTNIAPTPPLLFELARNN
ncbi:MAG: hypothetical protein LBG59_08840 [Candidatus Peribacteria bacterium]|nr:hypothetical protein [Candidatus Peribacteria bacterium]